MIETFAVPASEQRPTGSGTLPLQRRDQQGPGRSVFVLILRLSLYWSLFAAHQAVAQPKDTATVRIRPETVAGWLAESKVPAAGIGIIEKGVLRQARVYGKLRANLPAPDGTRFNVASLTKPVVALLTLVLVSRKQWSLDEPLAGYWVDPDVKRDALHKKLTTRHVLSHQSGFPNWRWDQPAQKLAFTAAPGTRFGYSGEGFEYLKRALEARFGTPLEQLADSVLFKPFSMPDTRFYWKEPMDTSRYAFAHDQQGKRYAIPAHTAASAADDLLTTVGDYGRFCAQVLTGAGLSAETFREMTTPQAVVNADKHLFWGLGWQVIGRLGNGEYALFHAGSDRGVRAAVILLPVSGRGLVVLTNGDGGGDLIRKIAAASLDVGKEIAERLR